MNGALVAADAAQPLSNSRHEQFAQLVAAGQSYKSAYLASFPNGATVVRHSASNLAARPEVQARVRAVQLAAARENQHDVRTYLRRLEMIATGDPTELCQIVREPCVGGRGCWTEDALVAAIDAAAAVNAPMPDTSQPNPSCASCGGRGVTHIELTPSVELSTQGRMLLKGVKRKSDGSVELQTQDQLQAIKLLSELSGWITSQHANLNVNANVSTPAPVSPQDLLASFHALRRTPPTGSEPQP